MLGRFVFASGPIGKQNIGSDPSVTFEMFSSLSSAISICLPDIFLGSGTADLGIPFPGKRWEEIAQFSIYFQHISSVRPQDPKGACLTSPIRAFIKCVNFQT